MICSKSCRWGFLWISLILSVQSPVIAATEGKLYIQSRGNIYITDLTGANLKRINSGYDFVGHWATDFPNGHIYIAIDPFSYPIHQKEAILRFNQYGTGQKTLIPSPPMPNDERYINSIALDTRAGKIYWTEYLHPVDTIIKRANIDGSGIEQIIMSNNVIPRVAIAPESKKLFYTAGGSLFCANLDGTDQSVLIECNNQFVTPCVGGNIVVSQRRNRVYWSGKLSGKDEGYIVSANFSGSNIDTLVNNIQLGTNGVGPSFLALDENDKEIYWAINKQRSGPGWDSEIWRSDNTGNSARKILDLDQVTSDIAVSNSFQETKLYLYNNNRFLLQPKIIASTKTSIDDETNFNICADGARAASLISLKHEFGEFKLLKFRIREDRNGLAPEMNGSFKLIYSNLKDSVVFQYQHPDFFYHERLFTPRTLEVFENEDDVLYEYKLDIYRAPIALLHGLWANSSSFQNMEFKFVESNRWPRDIILNFDYGGTADKYFWINKNVGLNAVRGAILKAVKNGYSSGRTNVIAHSMGGLLTRMFIQSNSFEDDISRFITLNTPHSGSQIANVLFENPWIGIALLTVGKNPFNGAIDDLRVDSDAIIHALNGESLNKHIVPSYSIVSYRNVYDGLGWGAVLLQLLTLHGSGLLLSEVYNNEENDIIVPFSSQRGGLSRYDVFDGLWHIETPDNNDVFNLLKSKLELSSQNSNSFSNEGFRPPRLEYNPPVPLSSELPLVYLSTDSIKITHPSAPTTAKPGQELTISAEGNGSISKILFLGGNQNVKAHFELQGTSSAIFIYKIPSDASGRIHLLAMGFNETGFVDMDSTTLDIVIDAQLDSIDVVPSEIYLSTDDLASVSIKGYFNDGVIRDISFDPSISYTLLDNDIATVIEPRTILGNSAGTTKLIALAEGDTASALVTIFSPEISVGIDQNQRDEYSRFPNDFTLYQNYPNPFNPSTTIYYEIIEAANIQLRIYDLLGRNIKTLVDQKMKPGIYSVFWNASDDLGKPVPTGIYIYQLAINQKILHSKKMLYIK